MGAQFDVDSHLKALIDEFCESYETGLGVSAHTIRGYRADLMSYGRWAERESVSPLGTTHRDIRGYLAELDRAAYSCRTINRHLSALRSFFRWLAVRGYVSSDPVSVLQGPRAGKNLSHAISSSDMTKILAVYANSDRPDDIRNKAILEFFYACGARVSEASELLAADVNFDSKQAKVFGRGGKERIVPLHDLAVSSMRAYAWRARHLLLDESDCPYFFVSTRGNKMSPDAIRKMFKKTLLLAGVDTSFTPHDMRHTFATDLAEGGADLRNVQELFGCERPSVLQADTHASSGRFMGEHRRAHPRG